MRALVTGSSGFIGSHLVAALIDKGWDVVEFDSPFDVVERDDWKQKLHGGVDYIYHLAGYLDHYGEKNDLSHYVDVNVRSVAVMFEALCELNIKVKKIVVASSQSVYGEGKRENKIITNADASVLMAGQVPAKELETDEPAPLSMYGASKAAMEDVLFVLGKLYAIPVAALRYSIVLGAGQKFKDMDSRILPCFVAMAKLEGKIVTHEDGQQSRDFVHIRDVVDATIYSAITPDDVCGIINIGSGRQTFISEVAYYIAAHYHAQVIYSGIKRIHTARHQIMDIGKIKSWGWFPKYTWQEAVDEYIKKADS